MIPVATQRDMDPSLATIPYTTGLKQSMKTTRNSSAITPTVGQPRNILLTIMLPEP